jgi:phosphoserine phosphatase
VLVALDFDGTLSPDEMIVLLAQQAGVRDRVEDVTARAMAGELEYAESLRERVRLLDGLDLDEVQTAFDAVRLRAGVPELIDSLAAHDIRIVILTGGFGAGVQTVLDEAGVTVDRIMANQLGIRDTELSGTVSGPLVEGTKDDALAKLADEFGIPIEDTVAVGDGANDLPMLSAAGFAIGFRPDPTVAPVCDTVVDSVADLSEVIHEHIDTSRPR